MLPSRAENASFLVFLQTDGPPSLPPFSTLTYAFSEMFASLPEIDLALSSSSINNCCECPCAIVPDFCCLFFLTSWWRFRNNPRSSHHRDNKKALVPLFVLLHCMGSSCQRRDLSSNGATMINIQPGNRADTTAKISS